ncbi:MAG: DUF928 domain-containing protein [Limnothrix sp. RL_2_0]|nr:DUF928 domain-containing protein [Limnothrix sp. RL_2_0]
MNLFSLGQTTSFATRLVAGGLVGFGYLIALAPGAIAASVGSCLEDSSAFGFVPESKVARNTVHAYPQVVWRLPENQAENLQIRVTDFSGQELYFWDYPLSHDPAAESHNFGLMSLQVPRTMAVTPLAVDETQTWEMTLVCDLGDRRQDLVINQEITRIALDDDSEGQLKAASKLEQIEFYQNNGLSHDALSLFLEWASQQPPESEVMVQQQWLDLEQKMGILK